MTDPTPPNTSAQTTKQSANRILKNARFLLSGRAIAGILSLGYLAIAARSLGPTNMGFLVLAHAYVLVIASLMRFQSWQGIIRFGGPLMDVQNTDQFKTLIRFTVKLDIITSIIAVTIALLCAKFVGRVMDWPTDAMPFIYTYCVAIPFLTAATPNGILRLFDRFKSLGWLQLVLPGVRFIGAIALWIGGASLTGFLTVWILSAIMEGVTLWIFAFRELRQRNLVPPVQKSADAKASQDWLPFMLKTNFTGTLELLQSSLPVLAIGAFLGGAPAGFLQLATNLSNLIAHPTNLLNQATFPELAKIHQHQGKKEMRLVAFRSLITALKIATPIVLAYAILKDFLATSIGGPEFAPAATVIALMATAQLWRISSIVLESAVLATGKAGFVLLTQISAAALNIITIIIGLNFIGISAAPTALIISWSAMIGLYLYAIYKSAPVPIQQ